MEGKRLFFILGAGASADSGLPTYRGIGGIYNNPNLAQPEDILCLKYLLSNPKEFWNLHKTFYDRIQKAQDVKSDTYAKLNQLIERNPKSSIMTQNIDGLAKSCPCEVVEMHGSWETMSCLKCNDRIKSDATKVYCECGGLYRPDVILFGENLEKHKVNQVYNNSKYVDYVIIVGSTLTFQYLRIFINRSKCKGAKVIHINPSEDYADNVRNNERWIKKTASEGLDELLSNIDK